MKKTIFILTLILSFFIFITGVNAGSTYLFRTQAIDQPSFDDHGTYVQVQNCEIYIAGSTTVSSNPAKFTVNADDVFSVVYECQYYQIDVDDYFFDSRISTCPTSGCYFVKDNFDTNCTYMSSYDRWYCIVSDTETHQAISFNYYKNDPTWGGEVGRSY